MGIQGHVLLVLCMVIAETMIASSALKLPDRKYGMHLIDRNSEALSTSHRIDSLNRTSFPTGFIFGAASSAYQIEGGTNKSTGKGPSIWDTFAHTYPEKIADGSNGDVAVDSYHRYKEDVALLKESNLDAYRFSISWSRILPTGKLSGGVNEKGIKYYSNLIDELHSKGLEPYITLFHWDLPQALHDEYGGLLNSKIVDDFVDYADLCFKTFGDRVKNWVTFNEPWTYTTMGYDSGTFAPGRCSAWRQNNCSGGDSGTEPYLVAHYQLLAHAAAVKLYKSKYQASQQGEIGIVLVTYWFVPYSNSSRDHRAAIRGLDFMLGWFMDPLINGDYPLIMRKLVGERLPKFTEEESKMVKGSYDIIGMNYYTANYALPSVEPAPINVSYSTDSRVNLTAERDGVLIGEQAGSDWLHVYPRGIGDLLLYIKRKYNNPPLKIMENGIDEVNNSTLSIKEALADSFRIKYYYSHLSYVHKAIKDGVNVMGYFAWSILDNYEWSSGYTVRFGINFVDYDDGLKRYQKLSSKWFKNFLKK